MSLSDDLARLADLHARGVLSDDEFARAKARTIESGTASTASTGSTGYRAGPADAPRGPVEVINGLQRSVTDRWIGGVCGGIARTLGLASWIVRLVFVLMVACAGTGVLLYVLMWILVPEEPLRIGYTPAPPQQG